MNQQNRDLQSGWWGTLAADTDTRMQLKCADLSLDLTLRPNDWLVQYEWQTNVIQPLAALRYINAEEALASLEKQQRFVFASPPSQLVIQPILADRPIVCRPIVSVMILPKEEISLYVSLPLWMQLYISDRDKPLLDIPTAHISDTWFGPNSREGEMSYVSRASEQLEVTPSDKHGMRATMEVKILNLSDEVVTLDKISVPTPNLDLYVDAIGRFWTRRITLTREGNEVASLTIDEEISCGIAKHDLTLVAKAREDIGQNKISKALWALFG